MACWLMGSHDAAGTSNGQPALHPDVRVEGTRAASSARRGWRWSRQSRRGKQQFSASRSQRLGDHLPGHMVDGGFALRAGQAGLRHPAHPSPPGMLTPGASGCSTTMHHGRPWSRPHRRRRPFQWRISAPRQSSAAEKWEPPPPQCPLVCAERPFPVAVPVSRDARAPAAPSAAQVPVVYPQRSSFARCARSAQIGLSAGAFRLRLRVHRPCTAVRSGSTARLIFFRAETPVPGHGRQKPRAAKRTPPRPRSFAPMSSSCRRHDRPQAGRYAPALAEW